MRISKLVAVISLLLTLSTSAQSPPAHETITRQTSDGATLVADFYPAETDAPVIMLLHMLNSNRAAYQPLIPDLRAAGYALLNVDMRGHGDSGGSRDWDLAIVDVADWIGWLDSEGHLGADGLAIVGGSIGANVAIIGCAESDVCVGAVALSPGLDYRGVRPEQALVDGLADRSALLVASHSDRSSADAVKQLFMNSRGDVSARLYRGRAHGTRLFDSALESVSRLIRLWLAEQFAADEDTQ